MLYYIIFWLAVIIAIITSALLSYSLLRSGRKSVQGIEPDLIPASSQLLDIVWIVIPIIILVTLLILTFYNL